MTRLIASLGALVLLLGMSTAYAARGPTSMSSGSSFYNKRPTKYEFKEGDLVEVGRGGPEGILVNPRLGKGFENLIKVRKDFVPEMLKAAEDL